MVYARILTHQGGFSSMIIDFNSYRNKKTEKITEEDIFNLILIFKNGKGYYYVYYETARKLCLHQRRGNGLSGRWCQRRLQQLPECW